MKKERSETGRPPAEDRESSLKKEDSQMVALNQSANPFERIADGLERLLEVLVPKASELVGSEYIAAKLGVSKQWVGKLASNGTIPKNWIAPKISGGRIWKFRRDRVDEWLKVRE